MNSTHERSWLLFVLQLFLGVGAVFGGVGLIIDPTGELIQMPLTLLDTTPFPNFLIPGIILFVILGVCPLIIAMALIKQWHWSMAESINIFKDRYWGWTFSLYSGFAVIIWISVQVYMLNAVSMVHMVYIGLGIIIQMITLLPSVQAIYKR